ncbi:HlyD family efflux transporter periplasmic adaptor subunit [Gimesia benthica]|uniref:HlyD family efflux transporter periplasmic adaptor subunit n=1 Tax=Gimesia benthica TaxID=2608982 RepID=A0A6I6AFY4_9PLAN|nr:efflux RND transporter periplasmic adaptor subunit [Gimesia benthica]QGQ24175.1 HlyD family efflux transporter periplasmic adaptor subunit [Gimesia benthica]
MSRKSILITVGLLAVLGLYYLFSEAPQPVDVTAAETGTVKAFIEERAKTSLPRIYRIAMPLNGRVMPITVQEDEKVTQGQVIAEMDTSDLDAEVAKARYRVEQYARKIIEQSDNRLEDNSLDQFDEFLKSMNLTVEAASKQQDASKAKWTYARDEYDRKYQLFQKNALSASELSEADLFKKQSEIDYQKDILTWRALQAIQSAMQIGKISIQKYKEKKVLSEAVLQEEKKEAESQLEQLQRDRNRATMRSPIDGTVLAKHFSNERTLPAGEILLELGQLDNLEVEADVLSQYVGNIHVGSPVDIEGPAIGPDPVQGKVKRIYPKGFTKISSLGVEQQRVKVIIGFDRNIFKQLQQQQRTLGTDFRVRVKIYTDIKPDVVKVSRSTLFRNGSGQWQAYVVRNNRTVLVDVEPGVMNDFEAEIKTGIKAGDRLIVAPSMNLTSGQSVEPHLIKNLERSPAD